MIMRYLRLQEFNKETALSHQRLNQAKCDLGIESRDYLPYTKVQMSVHDAGSE
jgi:hypothetical protein